MHVKAYLAGTSTSASSSSTSVFGVVAGLVLCLLQRSTCKANHRALTSSRRRDGWDVANAAKEALAVGEELDVGVDKDLELVQDHRGLVVLQRVKAPQQVCGALLQLLARGCQFVLLLNGSEGAREVCTIMRHMRRRCLASAGCLCVVCV